MHTVTHHRVREILAGCQGKNVAVIGDVMLDRYFWGNVSRISPEAPVPVVDIENESSHLGGASNVAANLRALGCVPLMLGVIGNDNSGKSVLEIMAQLGLQSEGIIVDNTRPTTVKTRVIGNNQQITRLDREVKSPISEDSSEKVLKALFARASDLSAIILEDYDKGVLTPYVISRTIEFANNHNIPVLVDPKFKNFFSYRHVTLFKPNKKETQDALGLPMNTLDEVAEAGREILRRLQAENILITLGARGMMLLEHSGEMSSVPTRARQVSDVSGAGDTVIATIAAMMSGGASLREAATLSNVAAGVVCGLPGIVAISPEMLLGALDNE